LHDASIIRNRAKIDAAVINAQQTLELKKQGSSLNDFLWRFVHHRQLKPKRRDRDEQPEYFPIAASMASELKKRGFKFLGPTTCYAFMQAVGMVNDHEPGCFRAQATPEESHHGEHGEHREKNETD
jgi:DNA-3-methyladenine glycosylase I